MREAVGEKAARYGHSPTVFIRNNFYLPKHL